MSMLTLAISCLTTSNLPWFMDLTFQLPMEYCSLQHWILLLSPVTSTTEYCVFIYFFFWLHPFIFLELFLHWSPVAYWAPNDLGSSSFSILSFCLFILFMGHGYMLQILLKRIFFSFVVSFNLYAGAQIMNAVRELFMICFISPQKEKLLHWVIWLGGIWKCCFVGAHSDPLVIC